MANEHIGLTASFDGSQAVKGIADLDRALENIEDATLVASTALQGLEKVSKKQAESANRTLPIYRQLVDIGNKYASTQRTLAQIGEKSAQSERNLTAALKQLEAARKSVGNISQEEAASNLRAVRVYGELIGVGKQYVSMKAEEARVLRETAAAEKLVADAKLKESQAGAASALENKRRVETELQQVAAKNAELAREQAREDREAAQAARERTQARRELARQEKELAQASTAGRHSMGATGSVDAFDDARQAAVRDAIYAQMSVRKQQAVEATKAEAAASKQAAEQSKYFDFANGQLTGNLPTLRYALYQVAAAYGATSAGMGALTVQAIKAASSHETAIAQIQRTTGESRDVFEDLIDKLRVLNTEIPATFEDLAGIASLGAQMGIARNELGEFTETVAKFSASTNVTIEQAATGFGRLSNLLKVPEEQFVNLGSAVSELGTNSAATDAEILNTAQSIAATAHTAGMSTQAVLGLSAAMASLKVSPEIGRSTLQRVFSQIDRAVADGTDKLDAFSNQLGLTNAQFIELYRTDPDQLFIDLLQSFEEVISVGGNITGVFDSLGVYSLRSAPTLQRLAGSVDMVTDSIDLARRSYASGTYLDTSTQPVFATIEAKAKQAREAVRNLIASFGETPVVSGGVRWFLDAIKELAGWLDRNLPSAVKTGALAMTGFIAVWAAYKAAVSLAMASLVAFRTALEQNFKTSQISMRGLLAEARNTFGGMKVGADQATVSVRANTAALQQATVASRAHTAAAQADAVATTAQGAAAGNIFSRLGQSLGGIGKIAGIGLGIGALSGLIDLIVDYSTRAEQAAKKQDEFNQALLNMGGADALSAALKRDSQAALEFAGDLSKMEGHIGRIVTTVDDLGDGTAQVSKTFYDARGESRELTTANVQLAHSTDVAAGAQKNMQTQVGLTIDQLKEQTVFIGRNTAAWMANAMQGLISGEGGFSAQEVTELRNAGIDLGKVLAESIKGGMDSGDTGQYLQGILDDLRRRIQEERSIRQASLANLETGFVLADDKAFEAAQREAQAAEERRKSYEAQAKAVEQLIAMLDLSEGSLSQLIATGQVTESMLRELGLTTEDLEDAADGAEEKVGDLETALRSASQAFGDIINDMQSVIDLQVGLIGAMDNLGASIAENGNDFSMYTDAGRKNLRALGQVVDAYAAHVQVAIDEGQLTLAEGTDLMYKYMVELMQDLGELEIPTAQIDHLVTYLAGVVGSDWVLRIDADTSTANQNIENTVNYALEAEALMREALGQSGQWSPAAKEYYEGLARQRAAAPPPPVAPSPLATMPNPDVLKEVLKLGKANREVDLYQQQAGKSAAAAGKQQTDAAKEAADAVKAQLQYVKDLAAYYGNLGKEIFSGVAAEGKVFESLQRLGISLEENGKRFNTMTDAGRKNFDALESTFSSFGDVLSQQVNAGTLTAEQASMQFRQFAAGVYGDLLKMGVPAKDIEAFFKGIGVTAPGWDKAGKAVGQYGGVLEAAADAARAAAEEQGVLNDKLQEAAEYADLLRKSFTDVYDSIYGLPTAVDATTKAWQALNERIQSNADKVKDLTKQNKNLRLSIQEQSVVANKAAINYQLAMKYGESDRAMDYKAQMDAAKERIKQDQEAISTNQKQIDELEKFSKSLQGNSKYALENRDALRNLQRTMIDQIAEYARAGNSQRDVEKYAKKLSEQFEVQARAAGLAKNELTPYTRAFDDFVNIVGKVPSSVTVTAKASTSAANAALNSLAKGRTVDYKTSANAAALSNTKKALNGIPKKADYVITPKLSKTSTPAVKVPYNPYVANATSAKNELKKALKGFEIPVKFKQGTGGGGAARVMFALNKGGPVRGFNQGGLVPGTPPANPNTDNVLASGPDGLYGLRSGEFVQSEPAVKHYGLPFMNAVNEMSYRPASGPTIVQLPDTLVVQLSPEDRRLLRDSGNRPIALELSAKQLAGEIARAGGNNVRTGGY